MKRANFVGAPGYFNLNMACKAIHEAFNEVPYLVGSSLERRDFRDVDVRLMLDDEDFKSLFRQSGGNMSTNPLWSLVCAAISEWLSARCGLPVDFQIQPTSEANKTYDGKRSALGIFLDLYPRVEAPGRSEAEAAP